MKYLDYKERREQGTFNFPIAYYHQTPRSPRYDMTYHWHEHFEIMYIISGSFHLTLDNATRVYNPGDIVFISSGMLHGGTPNNCIYDSIVFDMQMLLKDNHACAKVLHNIMNRKILIETNLSDKSKNILPVVENLSKALAGKNQGYEFLTQGYLYQLIGIILQENLYSENHTDSSLSERLNSVKDVLTYISENYNKQITLESLAKIAGMNPKYFCRYFRSMTERTPIDYLNYYRIECACELLSTKTISVKEAAISCGFNDESYFIKAFHKYKGITPKQFTKQEF